jgi:hypothetical protein
MALSVLDEEWTYVTSLLPEGWCDMARQLGAIRHEKGITDPEALLRLILLHVGGGLSLRNTVVRAQELGWPSMSDVALLKRLRTAEPWLQELTARLYQERRGRWPEGLVVPLGRRLRAVDATVVTEPGKTGSTWRLHYSVELPSMACDFYELTGEQGEEHYRRFPIRKGDILLADRGYAHREGVARVMLLGGDVVVRLTSTGFPLLDAAGEPVHLLSLLRGLSGHRPRAWEVSFVAGDLPFQARLCAVRRTRLAAERAKAALRVAARRKQRRIRPETLEFAEYIFVLTTLDASVFGAADVLQLYRARWQAELVFKRLKSLIGLGHLPKRDDASARAWIATKLLIALLIERFLDEARAFSPWGHDLEAAVGAP